MALPIISLLACGNASEVPHYTWVGWTSCAASTPKTVYTSESSLTTGIKLYTNSTLTLTMESSTFIKDNIVYTTDGSGTVSTAVTCHSTWVCTTTCGDSTPKTVYTAYGVALADGVFVYTDPSLDIAFRMVSSTVAYNLHIFTTNSSGEIISQVSCPTPFIPYTNCSQSTPLATKYVNGGIVELDAIIYTDPGGTSVWNGATFSYGGYTYTTHITTGVITVANICYEEFGMYSDCEQTAGTPTSYYAAFGSSLALTTTLYTDAALTTPVGAGYLAKDSVTYSTTDSGVIDLVYNCYSIAFIQAACDNAAATNVYAAPGVDPSTEGGKLYTAGMHLTEISPRYYVYGGSYYYYDATNGITFQNACGT
jgi:hypothetical protein